MHRTIPLSFALTVILVVISTGCRRNPPALDEDSNKPPPNPSPLSKALEIEAEYSTAQLSNDPDDPAIWVHPGIPRAASSWAP